MNREPAIHACAERADAAWFAAAEAAIRRYARQHRAERWRIEQARSWAHERGLPHPHDARAWGAVTRALAKSGVIRRAGYANGAINYSPKPLWRSA